MKTFKTFFFTTLFWMLVVLGLWISSFFYPKHAGQLLSTILPTEAQESLATEYHNKNYVEEQVTPTQTTQDQNSDLVTTGSEASTGASNPSAEIGYPSLEAEVSSLQNRDVILENNLSQVIAFLQSVTVVNPETTTQPTTTQPEQAQTSSETPTGVVNTF